MYHHQGAAAQAASGDCCGAAFAKQWLGYCHFFWVYQAMTSSHGAGDMSYVVFSCMCEQIIDFTGAGACPALARG